TFDGVTVSGTVMEASIDNKISIQGEHPTIVRFRYDVEGQSYIHRSIMLNELPLAFPANRAVEIEYVAWRPEWSRIASGNYSVLPMWAAVAFLFPLLGVILLFFAVRSNRRGVRAFRRGVVETGYVVFAGPDPTTTINGRHPHKVEWLFS